MICSPASKRSRGSSRNIPPNPIDRDRFARSSRGLSFAVRVKGTPSISTSTEKLRPGSTSLTAQPLRCPALISSIQAEYGPEGFGLVWIFAALSANAPLVGDFRLSTWGKKCDKATSRNPATRTSTWRLPVRRVRSALARLTEKPQRPSPYPASLTSSRYWSARRFLATKIPLIKISTIAAEEPLDKQIQPETSSCEQISIFP